MPQKPGDDLNGSSPVSNSTPPYRALFEQGGGLICTHSLDGTLLSANPAGADLLGYEPAELVGKNLFDLMPQETHQLFREYLRRISKNGADQGFLRLTAKNGTEHLLYYSNTLLKEPGKWPCVLGHAQDLTKIKAAEQAKLRQELEQRLQVEDTLRATQQQLRTVVENAPVILYSYDKQGIFKLVEGEALADLGQDRNSLLGRSIFDVFAKYPSVVDCAKRVLQGEGQTSLHEMRDLSLFWETRSLPVRNAAGEVIGGMGVALNVTDRMRSEEARDASEKRFTQFMDNSPVIASVIDGDTRVNYVNRSWLDLFKLRHEDVIGRTAFDLFPPPLAQHLYEQTKSVLRTGETLETVEAFPGPNGETRYVLGYQFSMPDRAGRKQLGVVGIDITERKRAEQALAEQRSFLRQVIDTNPNLIFAKDRSGRFTLVNKSMADVYGQSIEELTGKSEMDVHSVEMEAVQYRRDDMEVLNTLREKFIAEEPHTDAAGRLRWLQTVKRPILGRDGAPHQVLGVSTDITGRKSTEEALRRSEDDLLQAQKMEAIGRLAGGVAHDFNNLLNVMLGYTELILYTSGPEDPVRTYAENIRQSADRAAGLTKQLLAFSRKQVLSPAVIDLNTLLADVGRLLPRLIGEHIDVAVNPSREPVCIKADPVQIQQILMNLAVNARDAMPQGGQFLVQVESVELEENYARQLKLPHGPYAMLTVTDSGTGMSAETKARIFEPFYTTKEVGKGTGLGLSMVYGILRQSGGNITVVSEPGLGTSYKIYLPSVKSALCASPNPKKRGEPPRGSETILLVEDQDGLRMLTGEFLRRQGYSLLEASQPSRAIEIAEVYTGEIGLLLTDVIMPGMNGRALAQHLHSLRPQMKVLCVSGYTQEVLADEGAPGFDFSFMEKPFSLEALAKKVRELLDSSADTALRPAG